MTTDPGSTGDPGPLTTGIDPPDDDGGSDSQGEGSSSTGERDDETTTGEPEGSSSGDAGSDSDSDDSATSTTGNGNTFPCDFPTTCNGSDTLGGVAGDTATPPVTETGSEPIWLQVQVSENDSGVFANDMEVTIQLVSDGADFDLRAYLGGIGDTNGCGGNEQRSETSGVDTVSFTWGETGTFANNDDDGTFVAIEIFPKDDVCTVGASWALTVTGNTD